LVSVAVLGASLAIAPGCLSEATFSNQMACASDAECSDGNPCTADTCVAGACEHASAYVGMSCSDEMTCNGGGQCAACAVIADCGDPTPCASFACAGGACKATYEPAGTTLPDVTKGDCKRPACDGHGAVVEVADPSDVPASTGPCDVEACTAAGPTSSTAPVGTACSAGVCDDTGACVACNAPADCTSLSDPYCYEHQCASCEDGMQDGDETGVDCGGSHCGACGGQPCTSPTDCQTNSCIVTMSGDMCGWPATVPCMFDSECASQQCDAGACTAP
jgi:hypothetical protein